MSRTVDLKGYNITACWLLLPVVTVLSCHCSCLCPLSSPADSLLCVFCQDDHNEALFSPFRGFCAVTDLVNSGPGWECPWGLFTSVNFLINRYNVLVLCYTQKSTF